MFFNLVNSVVPHLPPTRKNGTGLLATNYSFENLHYLLFSTCFPVAQMLKTLPGNAGDPSSIPGLGRSAREWISYPVQYSWASLVAQTVKNLPAM